MSDNQVKTVKTYSIVDLPAARLAQSVEHQTFNLRVKGSSPLLGLIFKWSFGRSCMYYISHTLAGPFPCVSVVAKTIAQIAELETIGVNFRSSICIHCNESRLTHL